MDEVSHNGLPVDVYSSYVGINQVPIGTYVCGYGAEGRT